MPQRPHHRHPHLRLPALHRRSHQHEITVVGLGERTFRIATGSPYPLGATLSENGVNFAVYSKHAQAVFIALFDPDQEEPVAVLPLPERTHDIWHGLVHGLVANQLYALRIDGPWDPKNGHRFNSYKVLLDPYARAIHGTFSTEAHLHLGHDPDHIDQDLILDPRSNARVIPKCVVTGPQHFDWQGIAQPRYSIEDLVIYEVHLKGFTAHSSSQVKKPGTYLGFIEKIPYLKALGINAVEFLPLQAKYSEDHLTQRGLSNYWGYNTAAFFCLEPSYASQSDPLAPLVEFKTLVRELHRAGIEVILDVVYNHTAEGNENGPTLSFRGIDNATYYALEEKSDLRGYRNVTGCGNTLDFGNPAVIRLTMDSLRYLAEECRVDGFRFDLATVLGRQGQSDFKAASPFFLAITQDPVLSRVKLIAEPWDLQAYAIGDFPVEWSEWNGKFRDTLRRFIKGDRGQLSDLGWRLTGSADLYGNDGRGSNASINFVTCHDGFTLWDMVSYNRKHNADNGEENRDGSDHNDSWNCGVEGETLDPLVNALRRKQARNFFVLLFLSHGVPMLHAGDEFLRSQQGNNNAYCQDNAIGWTDWSGMGRDQDSVAFVAALIKLRHGLPTVKSRQSGDKGQDDVQPVSGLLWASSEGQSPNWQSDAVKHVAYFLDPSQGGLGHPHSESTPVRRIGVFINAEEQGLSFVLPLNAAGHGWFVVVQTAADTPIACLSIHSAIPLGDLPNLPVPSRSIVVLLEKSLTLARAGDLYHSA